MYGVTPISCVYVPVTWLWKKKQQTTEICLLNKRRKFRATVTPPLLRNHILGVWADFCGTLCGQLQYKCVSWCIAVFTVRNLGTSPTISSHPLTSLLGFVCVPQTDTSSSYLAVDSTHTAVGRFRSPVRRSGTRCLTSSEIRRVVLTVLNSSLRQSCLVSTNDMISAH